MEGICLNYQRSQSDTLTSYVRAIFDRWLRVDYTTEEFHHVFALSLAMPSF